MDDLVFDIILIVGELMTEFAGDVIDFFPIFDDFNLPEFVSRILK